MKQVAWMAGASIVACATALAFVERASGVALVFGMLGPLALACGSWVMAERTYRQDPRALTGLMVTAFAFKLVFFGGYVAVMLRGCDTVNAGSSSATRNAAFGSPQAILT